MLDCHAGGWKAFTDCMATAAANKGSTCAARCLLMLEVVVEEEEEWRIDVYLLFRL